MGIKRIERRRKPDSAKRSRRMDQGERGSFLFSPLIRSLISNLYHLYFRIHNITGIHLLYFLITAICPIHPPSLHCCITLRGGSEAAYIYGLWILISPYTYCWPASRPRDGMAGLDLSLYEEFSNSAIFQAKSSLHWQFFS